MNLTTITNSHCPLPRACATVGLPDSAQLASTRPYSRVSPDAHSVRAQRAGGRSYCVPPRTKLPLLTSHGRTSPPWHLETSYLNCNVSCKIRRACATVGLPDSVRSTSPLSLEKVLPDTHPERAQPAGNGQIGSHNRRNSPTPANQIHTTG